MLSHNARLKISRRKLFGIPALFFCVTKSSPAVLSPWPKDFPKPKFWFGQEVWTKEGYKGVICGITYNNDTWCDWSKGWLYFVWWQDETDFEHPEIHEDCLYPKLEQIY